MNRKQRRAESVKNEMSKSSRKGRATIKVDRAAYEAAEVKFQEGINLRNEGKTGEAKSAFTDAINLCEHHAPSLCYLGILCNDQQDYSSAETFFLRALDIDPDLLLAHLNLGNTYSNSENLQGAIDEFQSIILAGDAFLPEAYANMGNVLSAMGDLNEALKAYYGALHHDPNSFHGLNGLGSALTQLKRYPEAEALFLEIAKRFPGMHEPLANLGVMFSDAVLPEKAVYYLKKALEIRKDDVSIYRLLSGMYFSMGLQTEGEDAILRSIELDPNDEVNRSNLIFFMDFNPTMTPKHFLEERINWNNIFISPLADKRRPHDNDTDPDRKLRIGYVSADFRKHSAAYCFGPVILERDKSQFDAICYSNHKSVDAFTDLFKEGASEWRSISLTNDDQVAEQIRKDKIDILVDLSGHSTGNRLKLFGLKPAPIQVTAFGYSTGTGLETMDYLFTEEIWMPPEENQYYREELVYLPAPILYKPFSKAPDVGPLPALANGYLTFGCFTRSSRISDETLALWAGILKLLPTSKVVFKGYFSSTKIRKRILTSFEDNGIDVSRIGFMDQSSWFVHLNAYNKIDIVLDTVPHGGGISLIDALWMGVPAVTLKGKVQSCRIGGGILTAAGLPDWVANTPQEYINKILVQARDIQGLSALRAGLREQVAQSPVGNAQTFVGAVEDAYRTIWRRWCEKNTKS